MPKQDLKELYATNLGKVKACELALRRTLRRLEPDTRMKRMDELLGGYGVEALRGEWKNGYWGDVVATYINFGGTYDTTIVCLRTGSSRWDCRYSITSYGDFVEKYGERLGIQ